VAILHLADDLCFFDICINNKLVFYRELPVSLNQLNESLRSALVSDRGRVELSAEEAEEVLFTVGVPQQDANYKDKISSTQILSMLRPVLERLAAEIKRSITYYQTHFQGGIVSDIAISGKGMDMPNLDSFLSKELSLGVKKIVLSDKIQVLSEVNPDAVAQSYASLGLALDYKTGINLLPSEFRTEKIERFQRISLRWTIFIVSLLLVVSFIFAKAGVGFYQKRLDNARVYLNVLSEVAQIKTKIDQLDNFVTEVRNAEIPAGDMLRYLSSITGKELFFVDFSLDNDSKKGSIKGYIRNSGNNPNTILTTFIADMKKSDYFSEVNIVSVSKNDSRGFESTEFEISFTLP
jgi:hypothetical protein